MTVIATTTANRNNAMPFEKKIARINVYMTDALRRKIKKRAEDRRETLSKVVCDILYYHMKGAPKNERQDARRIQKAAAKELTIEDITTDVEKESSQPGWKSESDRQSEGG